MLAAEIRIEVAFRDFGARRDIDRADAAITPFRERFRSFSSQMGLL
jgi:hypothetical protein